MPQGGQSLDSPLPIMGNTWASSCWQLGLDEIDIQIHKDGKKKHRKEDRKYTW